MAEKCIWYTDSEGVCWLPDCEGGLHWEFPKSGYCPWCGLEIEVWPYDPTPWEAPVGPDVGQLPIDHERDGLGRRI